MIDLKLKRLSLALALTTCLVPAFAHDGLAGKKLTGHAPKLSASASTGADAGVGASTAAGASAGAVSSSGVAAGDQPSQGSRDLLAPGVSDDEDEDGSGVEERAVHSQADDSSDLGRRPPAETGGPDRDDQHIVPNRLVQPLVLRYNALSTHNSPAQPTQQRDVEASMMLSPRISAVIAQADDFLQQYQADPTVCILKDIEGEFGLCQFEYSRLQKLLASVTDGRGTSTSADILESNLTVFRQYVSQKIAVMRQLAQALCPSGVGVDEDERSAAGASSSAVAAPQRPQLEDRLFGGTVDAGRGAAGASSSAVAAPRHQLTDHLFGDTVRATRRGAAGASSSAVAAHERRQLTDHLFGDTVGGTRRGADRASSSAVAAHERRQLTDHLFGGTVDAGRGAAGASSSAVAAPRHQLTDHLFGDTVRATRRGADRGSQRFAQLGRQSQDHGDEAADY